MDIWNSIAERKIREAMEEGAFDSLAGKGQPLDLEENPFEDPSLRMAHRLLRNNGFAPAWVEERKQLENDAAFARAEFARTGDRKLLQTRFQEINRHILDHNLKTPAAALHLLLINPDEE